MKRRSRTARAVQHRRKADQNRVIMSAVTLTIIIATIAGGGIEEHAATATTMEEEPRPYYVTEEYAKMKQEEARQAQEEAETIRQSIEDYQRRQEEEAQRLFEEAQSSLDVVPAEDTEQEDDGFRFYEIPEEYARAGGNFPEEIQRHLYAECKKNGIRYATGIGLVEQESGYQPDVIGEDGDSGYMQWIPRYQKDSMEELGVKDPTDPKGNISVGMRQLGELKKKYDGNEAKALTAYNSGPTGAYENYFSAGQDASPYAKAILQRAARIEQELGQGE